MTFDTTVNPLDVRINADEDESLVQLAITVGTVLPFSTSPNGAPLPVPIGVIRLNLDRDVAIQIAEKVKETAEPLKPRSNIVTASSLSGIDEAAKLQTKLRGE